MKKALTEPSRKIGMRVLVMVTRAHRANPDFVMADLAQAVMDKFGCSRSSAYRYLCDAADVLGIGYKISVSRAAQARERRRRGIRTAATLKSLGYA